MTKNRGRPVPPAASVKQPRAVLLYSFFMAIIFYHSAGKGDGIRKHIAVSDDLPFEEFTSLEGFFTRLRSRRYCIAAVVVLITEQKDIEALVQQKELLEDLKIIIAMDGPNQEDISRIHRVSPRYISMQSPHFQDLKEVLKKMCKKEGWHGAESRSKHGSRK